MAELFGIVKQGQWDMKILKAKITHITNFKIIIMKQFICKYTTRYGEQSELISYQDNLESAIKHFTNHFKRLLITIDSVEEITN